MLRLLVVYGTTDGQTAKIAHFLAEEFCRLSSTAAVVEAGVAWPNPLDYDGVVVAASVHRGRYQPRLVEWTRTHASALHQRHTAFLSVCLGALQRDPATERDLADIVGRFMARTGWFPVQQQHVAGALKYTRYNWLTRAMMRWIARRAGGSTDTSRDHEYTDWVDLKAFAATFQMECAAMAAPRGGSAAPREGVAPALGVGA